MHGVSNTVLIKGMVTVRPSAEISQMCTPKYSAQDERWRACGYLPLQRGGNAELLRMGFSRLVRPCSFIPHLGFAQKTRRQQTFTSPTVPHTRLGRPRRGLRFEPALLLRLRRTWSYCAALRRVGNLGRSVRKFRCHRITTVKHCPSSWSAVSFGLHCAITVSKSTLSFADRSTIEGLHATDACCRIRPLRIQSNLLDRFSSDTTYRVSLS